MPPLPEAGGVAYQLTFWGTRGSIPTPGPQTTRYGGNTACISLAAPDGRLIILDAGSGLRPLGHELMSRRGRAARRRHPAVAHPLGSHPGPALLQAAERQRQPVLRVRRRAGGRAAGGDPAPPDGPDGLPGAARGARRQDRGARDRRGRGPAPRTSTSAPSGSAIPGTTLGYRLAPTDGGREIAYLTDNELGTGGTYPVSADWRAAAGAVSGRSRHPDPRRDVLGSVHSAAARAGDTRRRARRSSWRRRRGARG